MRFVKDANSNPHYQHLGFIASVDKTMLMPMIVSKLVGGGAAVLLAIHVNKKKS